MDQNNGGFVLLDEFCKWIEKGEIAFKTEIGLELMIGESDPSLTNRSGNSNKKLFSKHFNGSNSTRNNEKTYKLDSSLADKIANKYTKKLKDYEKDDILNKYKNWELIDNNPSS